MKMMRIQSPLFKFLLILLPGSFVPGFFKAASGDKTTFSFKTYTLAINPDISLYDSLGLDSLGLSREAFNEGVTGYRHLKNSGNLLNPGILSIIDFSLPSFKKRLFILDLEKGKLLFNSLVAHGRNSGQVIATKFSNKFRSFESSLGFYLTGEPYQGQNGYSLHLLGMEHGINNNAFSRGIVVHAASYVNEEVAVQYGRLGRSEGCPAIPQNIHRAVIEKIKSGSCFFIYAKDKKYTTRSSFLRESRFS